MLTIKKLRFTPPPPPLTLFNNHLHGDFVRIRTGRKEYKTLPIERIAYVHGHRRKSTVYQLPPYDNSPIASTASLAELSTLLLPLSFIRCYRNYIVNPLALKWQRTDRITLPQGKSIPVSPQRVRPLRKEQALPATILYARLYDGLCLIATQGGQFYTSQTTLSQLVAEQPHLVRLNRWAVVNPSAIASLALQPKPMATMADGVQIAVSKRCLKVLPAHLKNQINHERKR